jgi:cephalosporin hydroxylase
MHDEIANEARYIEAMGADEELRVLRRTLRTALVKHRYAYNFTWFGRPIIQFPEDIVTLQTLVLSVKPDLIVETGVAHGGTLVFFASMLELLGGGEAVGVEVELRAHNRAALEAHPLRRRLRVIEGSSTDDRVAAEVAALARDKRAVMVVLDSNHTHAHVLRELELYAPLVTKDSYLVVFDTAIEDLPEGTYPDRPWGRGDNPATAVRAFLEGTDRFVVDRTLESRLLHTMAPGGYLRCVKA